MKSHTTRQASLFSVLIALAIASDCLGDEVLKSPSLTLLAEGSDEFKDVAPIVVGIGGLMVAAISLATGYWFNRQTLVHKAHEDEIKHIQEQLNSFFGPVKQLLGTSKLLHDILSSRQPDPENFKTLVALLEGVSFNSNDQTLIKEIIDVTCQIDKLIMDKCGLVSDDLQTPLWEASRHFRLIRLAHEGALSGDVEDLKRFVYPRHLNDAIDKEIEQLKKHLTDLKQKILSPDVDTV